MPIMIDLETTAVSPDAGILSIGACEFSYVNRDITNTFYRRVGMFSQPYARVDFDTMAWHMSLPEDARKEMIECMKSKFPIKDALNDLWSWVYDVQKHDPGVVEVWSHGATFDIPIVLYHIAQNGYDAKKFFDHRTYRDTRTLYENVGFKDIDPSLDYLDYMLTPGGHPARYVQQIGVAHNALDDAVYQARCVTSIYSGRKNLYLTTQKPEVANVA